MPRAVRFGRYDGIDVLHVVEVERPAPGPGELLVRVKAAGINPGDASIREGRMHERWPATFSYGEGVVARIRDASRDSVDASSMPSAAATSSWRSSSGSSPAESTRSSTSRRRSTTE
jgi:NADPH:quinone reductase-like Zn-dependent oxidoreductase